MNRLIATFAVLMIALSARAQDLKAGRDLPAVPTIPEVGSPKPNGSVPLGDVNTFREIQLDIPICDGPFKPSWESIEQNYPRTAEVEADRRRAGDYRSRRVTFSDRSCVQNRLI